MSSETPAEFIASWTAWHTARERSVRAPHGIAALRFTHWLTEEATVLEGAPGTWRADETGIVGERLTGTGLTTPSGAQIMTDRVELVHGDELHFGDALLRGMERDGVYALRVLDPEAPTRTSLAGISAFAPDVAWIRPARFVPSPDVTVETESTLSHAGQRHHQDDQAAAQSPHSRSNPHSPLQHLPPLLGVHARPRSPFKP